jgi:hypothetical protein
MHYYRIAKQYEFRFSKFILTQLYILHKLGDSNRQWWRKKSVVKLHFWSICAIFLHKTFKNSCCCYMPCCCCSWLYTETVKTVISAIKMSATNLNSKTLNKYSQQATVFLIFFARTWTLWSKKVAYKKKSCWLDVDPYNQEEGSSKIPNHYLYRVGRKWYVWSVLLSSCLNIGFRLSFAGRNTIWLAWWWHQTPCQGECCIFVKCCDDYSLHCSYWDPHHQLLITQLWILKCSQHTTTIAPICLNTNFTADEKGLFLSCNVALPRTHVKIIMNGNTLDQNLQITWISNLCLRVKYAWHDYSSEQLYIWEKPVTKENSSPHVIKNMLFIVQDESNTYFISCRHF